MRAMHGPCEGIHPHCCWGHCLTHPKPTHPTPHPLPLNPHPHPIPHLPSLEVPVPDPSAPSPLLLSDLLAASMQPESVLKNCDACGAKSAPHTVRHVVTRLPRVLVLHFKRFCAEEVGGESWSGTFRSIASVVAVQSMFVVACHSGPSHSPLVTPTATLPATRPATPTATLIPTPTPIPTKPAAHH